MNDVAPIFNTNKVNKVLLINLINNNKHLGPPKNKNFFSPYCTLHQN